MRAVDIKRERGQSQKGVETHCWAEPPLGSATSKLQGPGSEGVGVVAAYFPIAGLVVAGLITVAFNM
jgi:hypothetical protein